MNQLDRKKWMQLHQIAKDLFERHDPMIERLGIISVILPAQNEPHYVLFLEDNLLVFPGEGALSLLFMLSEKEQMPSVQRLRYQHHLAAYRGSQDDVSVEGLALLNELNLPVSGEVIFFESSIPNLLPDILSISEVKTMTDVLKQCVKLLDEVKDSDILSTMNEDMTLVRSFDFDSGTWINSVKMLEVADQRVVKPKVKEEFLEKLRQAPANEDVLEVDVVYTPIMAEGKEGHRQAVVRILLIANQTTRSIPYQKLITLKDEPMDHFVSAIVNHTLEAGTAKKWLVRDEIMAEIVSMVAAHAQVEVEISQQLPIIDQYVEELIKNI